MPYMGIDRSETKQRQDRRRVTVAEASEILGITAEAVRTRIKRGKLDFVKEPPDRTGTVYVLLQADQTRPNADPTSQGQDKTTDQTTELIETLREQVAYLQGVIATRDQELALRAEEIRRRDTALEREQQLTAMFADRLQELEAPVTSSESRESDASLGPTDELEELREELGAEQARRETAESTLHEGMDEERWRREEAERERDELRRELHALRQQRESPEPAEEQQGRGEPRPATGEAQEGAQRRPWWRRVFGG
jgi:DNA repair exonuclease SbcCD ATPase subunit